MLDRKDAYSAIPQLEKKIDAISTAQEEAGLNYDAFKEQTRQELEIISGEIVEAADLADSKVGISNYYSDKEILDNTIDGINTAIDCINSTTDNLSSAVSKELVFNGFANFTSEPKLTLGKTTSEWKVIVTNDGIFLQKSSNDVASLSKEMSSEETTLRADNARLANVKFRSANGGGKLGIVAQSNGHVSLKEI